MSDNGVVMEKIKTPFYVVELARQLRRKQTPAEEVLWACLRNRRLAGAKFRRQHTLGRYIADFYCHEARLVIELQGSIHDKDDQREYDAARQEMIEQQGIIVLHFKNEEVMRDLEGVLAEIEKTLTPSSQPLSRRERGLEVRATKYREVLKWRLFDSTLATTARLTSRT